MNRKNFGPRKSALPSMEFRFDAAYHAGSHALHKKSSPSQLHLLPSPQAGAPDADDLDLARLSTHWRQSRDEFEEARLDYISADLDECLTFAGIVEAEYKTGNREHAERTLAAIEECYSDMLRLYRQANALEPRTKAEFESKFTRVRERLDRIRE